ncbi:signal peptidase II [Microbacterium paludicola]|uniref:Lipoprotein signal peptidase n=1 Tax=Microbacterium paludicola TaxID=300019 RepID=A0A4Y9FZV6_9MICO|nr:signal peptidase II [Microbacterium paludicola]MBF0815317.1 signal peptidase II [Microbacterium paludicola]TFU34177.1 signal peptidase II [Microbacterium paludicola]
MTDRAPLRTAAASTTIAILAVLVLAADQFAKQLALRSLEFQTPVPVLGEVLQWYLVLNPGAAFSIGEGVTWIFSIALAVVACAIIWIGLTRVGSRIWAVVLGLLLGGVLGNLTDRLFRDPGFAVGHVVDFISTPWMMPAIYNVADIFIVCSMITVAALTLFGVSLDGSGRKTVAEAAAESAADEADAAETTGDGTTDGVDDRRRES